MMRDAACAGWPVLFCAHRRELIFQPAACLAEAGVAAEQVGLIIAGERENRSAPIQIASVDTLINRQFPPARLVIIDEAHRALAASYRKILERYAAACVVGLTATPYRGDGRGLGEVFDELVVTLSYRELVEEGYLVAPEVWTTAALPDLEGVPALGGDYDPIHLGARCNQRHIVGDIVEHWRRLGGGAPTLAFAVNVAHAGAIAKAFSDAGVRAATVHGGTRVAERAAAFTGLADGSIAVVANCDVATEGTDIPCVKTVILARPTMSLRVYLQQCGRGSRPHGELPFVVLDHAGCAVQYGLPQDDREWSLEGRKRSTIDACRLPPAWACPACFGVNPISASVCERCGTARVVPARPQPKTVAGRLELAATDGDRWDVIVEWWHQRNKGRALPLHPYVCVTEWRRRFRRPPPTGYVLPQLSADDRWRLAELAELKRIARRRGYSPRWPYVRLKERVEPCS